MVFFTSQLAMVVKNLKGGGSVWASQSSAPQTRARALSFSLTRTHTLPDPQHHNNQQPHVEQALGRQAHDAHAKGQPPRRRAPNGASARVPPRGGSARACSGVARCCAPGAPACGVACGTDGEARVTRRRRADGWGWGWGGDGWWWWWSWRCVGVGVSGCNVSSHCGRQAHVWVAVVAGGGGGCAEDRDRVGVEAAPPAAAAVRLGGGGGGSGGGSGRSTPSRSRTRRACRSRRRLANAEDMRERDCLCERNKERERAGFPAAAAKWLSARPTAANTKRPAAASARTDRPLDDSSPPSHTTPAAAVQQLHPPAFLTRLA